MTWAPGERFKRHFRFVYGDLACGRKPRFFTLSERRIVDTDCEACKKALSKKLKFEVTSNSWTVVRGRKKMSGPFPILLFGNVIVGTGHSWTTYEAARREGRQMLREFGRQDVRRDR